MIRWCVINSFGIIFQVQYLIYDMCIYYDTCTSTLNNSNILWLYKATEKIGRVYSKQVLFTWSDQGLDMSQC